MDPEDKRLLEETLKIGRENNRLLRKMYSSMKWTRFFRILYWAIIIGSAFGLYYFLQPYIDEVKQVFPNLGAGTQTIIDQIK